MQKARRPRRGWNSALVVATTVMLGLTACTSGPAPPDGPSVAVDGGAKLAISPVDYDGKMVVTAQFSEPAAGSQVKLQRREGTGWADVGTAKQDADGAAELTAPTAEGEYRAVAGEGADAVATLTSSAAQQWQQALSSDFTEADLPAPWKYSISGSYAAGGRQCSAPYPSNVKLGNGKAVLSMTKETEPDYIAAAKAAGCKKGEYYRNGMLTTEGQFSIRQGSLAARVKLGKEQGMHGSVFLLSSKMQEIDMIESYGYGWGLTSVIHVDGKRKPVKNSDTYVLNKQVKDRAWWDQYHVFSAEWDRDDVVFRVDGVETRRLHDASLDEEYFVFVSLLSSDWELKRLNDPLTNAEGVRPTKLPGSMSVDWVKAWTRA